MKEVKYQMMKIKQIFKYEKWMDDIFEREVIENYFDFNKALKLIKLDLAKKNVENIDLLSELDLRNKWTEFEFLKFRKDEDNNSYFIKKDDVLFEEEKRKEVEKNLKLNQDDNNKGVSIKIKEEEINEDDYNNNKKNEEDLDEIDTSSSKLIKKLQSNKDDLDAID